jgi:hypothetical protein
MIRRMVSGVAVFEPIHAHKMEIGGMLNCPGCDQHFIKNVTEHEVSHPGQVAVCVWGTVGDYRWLYFDQNEMIRYISPEEIAHNDKIAGRR